MVCYLTKSYNTLYLQHRYRKTGLHSSESSRGQMINIYMPRAASLFILEEILERQLLIPRRTFATFFTIQKALAAACGPYVVQACRKE